MKRPTTKWADVPMCPVCKGQENDWWDGLKLKYDGDEWEYECSGCGAALKTTISVSYDFLTVSPLT